MKIEYLIRLDDACPTMDVKKWNKIEDILDKFGIRPMVGIIPANADKDQLINLEDTQFWNKVHGWISKQWTIALHGFDHVCISNSGLNGMNPIWKRSEFSGVPLEYQKEKIRKGVAVLRSHGINPKYFFAPSHTFDENTLIALKEESDIRIISDTIANKPYKIGDFTFIPQIGGHCFEPKLWGQWTFCLHPSTMQDADFAAVEQFISEHKHQFIGFEQIDITNAGQKNIISKIMDKVYFARRKKE